jgi:outer membrane immunogenic protein
VLAGLKRIAGSARPICIQSKREFARGAIGTGCLRQQSMRRMGDDTMNSKVFGTALAALGFLASSFSTQAADIPRPVYKGIRPVVAYYNWTGFYVGLNAGYGFGTSKWSDTVSAASVKPKGGLFGGTLGYNYQVGSVVWGLEGDIDWSGVKGSTACAPLSTCEVTNRWLSTFRGRLGYAFDRWLPYLTVGGAYGSVKATETSGGLVASVSKNQLGWTGGVGVEYAFLGNWTAKLEYLYVDLGKFDDGVAPVTTVTFKENIVRAGLNYKFSGPIFSHY